MEEAVAPDEPASPVSGHRGFSADFLTLPNLQRKPRRAGLTHVIDRGVPLQTVRAVVDECGDDIDFWKFGWGTAYVSRTLPAKVELLERAGIHACLGGTLLEIAWAQGKVEECLHWAQTVGLGFVEVSRGGAVDMTAADKQRLIRMVSRRFTVLAEVGSKDPDQPVSVAGWRSEIVGDREAGAAYAIAEGRESGTVGIYEADGRIREELVDGIVEARDIESVIFEGPRKDQQAWLIRRFGPNVNVGNVALDDVVPLKTLRLGLRADTMELSVHPPEDAAGEGL